MSKNTGKVHKFANLVCCDKCKRGLKKNNNTKNAYLTCRTKKELGNTQCTGVTINYNTLEEQILIILQTQINLITDMQKMVDKINSMPEISNKSERIENDLKRYKSDYEKAESLFDNSYYDYNSGIISKEQYQRIREKSEQTLFQIRDMIQKAIEEKAQFSQGIKSNNEFFTKFLKHGNIEELDRSILLEFIHKIYVCEDNSLKVEFNFKDQYELILDYIKANLPEESIKPKALTRKP